MTSGRPRPRSELGSSPVRPCPAPNETMSCGGFFDPTTSTGLAAQANWRIYDFGQTSASIRARLVAGEAVSRAERDHELRRLLRSDDVDWPRRAGELADL